MQEELTKVLLCLAVRVDANPAQLEHFLMIEVTLARTVLLAPTASRMRSRALPVLVRR